MASHTSALKKHHYSICRVCLNRLAAYTNVKTKSYFHVTLSFCLQVIYLSEPVCLLEVIKFIENRHKSRSNFSAQLSNRIEKVVQHLE